MGGGGWKLPFEERVAMMPAALQRMSSGKTLGFCTMANTRSWPESSKNLTKCSSKKSNVIKFQKRKEDYGLTILHEVIEKGQYSID